MKDGHVGDKPVKDAAQDVAEDVYAGRGGEEAKFHKAKPERKSGEPQILSGRILAGSLVPELKSGLKFSLGALISGTNLRSTRKKLRFDLFFP